MLAARHRLRSRSVFAETTRRGRRAGTTTLVLHLAVPAETGRTSENQPERPQVGFVVSRRVGNAATRNKVKRRLRHLVRERLGSLPGRAVLVVRALPASATASYAELGADFDAALRRVLSRAEGRPAAGLGS